MIESKSYKKTETSHKDIDIATNIAMLMPNSMGNNRISDEVSVSIDQFNDINITGNALDIVKIILSFYLFGQKLYTLIKSPSKRSVKDFFSGNNITNFAVCGFTILMFVFPYATIFFTITIASIGLIVKMVGLYKKTNSKKKFSMFLSIATIVALALIILYPPVTFMMCMSILTISLISFFMMMTSIIKNYCSKKKGTVNVVINNDNSTSKIINKLSLTKIESMDISSEDSKIDMSISDTSDDKNILSEMIISQDNEYNKMILD